MPGGLRGLRLLMILLVFLETTLMMVGFNRHLANLTCFGGDWAWTGGRSWVHFLEKVSEKNVNCLNWLFVYRVAACEN